MLFRSPVQLLSMIQATELKPKAVMFAAREFPELVRYMVGGALLAWRLS